MHTIISAMNLNLGLRPDSSAPDLDHIGGSKARSYKRGGPICVVWDGASLAIVQGYRPGLTIDQCLPTCIHPRELAGHARNCYGDKIPA